MALRKQPINGLLLFLSVFAGRVSDPGPAYVPV